jgi:hypothetical protein
MRKYLIFPYNNKNNNNNNNVCFKNIYYFTFIPKGSTGIRSLNTTGSKQSKASLKKSCKPKISVGLLDTNTELCRRQHAWFLLNKFITLQFWRKALKPSRGNNSGFITLLISWNVRVAQIQIWFTGKGFFSMVNPPLMDLFFMWPSFFFLNASNSEVCTKLPNKSIVLQTFW